MKTYLWVFLSASFIQSCGAPLDYMDQELKKIGYIRYVTPMKELGTGTLVGGTPENLSFVTGSRTCFPDATEKDGISTPTLLRAIDETTLPRKNEKIFFTSENFVRLFEVLKAGNISIKAGLNLNRVQAIEFQLEGLHVEYMDSLRLTQFYRSGLLNPICQEYLNSVAFIIQAIKVDKLRFAFTRTDGGHFDLTVENIENFLDIGSDSTWRIENQTSLVIDKPHYLGYQLGSLRAQDDSMVLYRATSAKFNRFDFRPIYVFKRKLGLGEP
jgi:hypothetical protein